MISLLLCSVSMMFDGVSIGSKQMSHLPRISYAATFACLAWLLLSHQLFPGLGSVWWSMPVFFIGRASLHVLHVQQNRNISPFGRYFIFNLILSCNNRYLLF